MEPICLDIASTTWAVLENRFVAYAVTDPGNQEHKRNHQNNVIQKGRDRFPIGVHIIAQRPEGQQHQDGKAEQEARQRPPHPPLFLLLHFEILDIDVLRDYKLLRFKRGAIHLLVINPPRNTSSTVEAAMKK